MFRTIMIAAFAAATGSAALAAPATPAASGMQGYAPSHVVQPQVVHVRKDRDWRRHSRDYRRDYRRHYGYAPGAHVRHAPRGWHRYHARPYNWRTRNCVMVGPVWFCP